MEHKLGIFLIAFVLAIVGIQLVLHLLGGEYDIKAVVVLSILLAIGCAFV